MPAQNSFTRLDSAPSSSPRARRVERARVVQAEDLDLDPRLREPLAHERVAEPAARRARLRQAVHRQLVQHLLLPDERRAALVGERRVRDAPALVLRTDEVLDRDLDVVEEDLVELALTGDLAQRTDLDALRRHRDREHRDARVVRRVRVGAHQRDAPVRRTPRTTTTPSDRSRRRRRRASRRAS